MVFRIAESDEDGGHVVRVEGDLNAEAAGTLREHLARNGVSTVVLDLSQVRSTDREGADFLREAERLGLELRGTSPYLELLIGRRQRGEST
jgi:anti-anti-sigma regulatory factor